MKLWEIDWTEGKTYKSTHVVCRDNVWKVVDGNLEGTLGRITEIYNLQIILESDFTPHVDWSKVEIDTKIYVSNDNKNWVKRYFAQYNNDTSKVYAFKEGATLLSANDEKVGWIYAKIAESES